MVECKVTFTIILLFSLVKKFVKLKKVNGKTFTNFSFLTKKTRQIEMGSIFHLILVQKIVKLNGEIKTNFHDFFCRILYGDLYFKI